MSTEIDAEIVATCEAAVTLLTENGWTRNAYMNDSGQACAAGAVLIAHWRRHGRDRNGHIAIRNGLRDCPAIPAVAEVIRERHLDRIPLPVLGDVLVDQSTIYAFNDHPATTQDEVIEVLQETIKRHTHDEHTSTPTEAS